MKGKVKRIILSLIIATIGINNGVYAEEMPVQTLQPIDIWHSNITQFTKNIITAPTPTPEVHIYEQAASMARQYLGVPYVWGGTTPNGFDCSGLVQYVYKQLGINISRTTYYQVNDGVEVSKNELKQGDLVFFRKNGNIHHVGIYIGGGQFIHAPQTGEVVKISNLSDRSDYYTARRIVNE